MDYIWITVAFAFGFLAKQIHLPPLVGYLIAGFVLHAQGVEFDDSLKTLENIGIALLLFTIGLKLDLKSLFKKEIWGTATSHMTMVILLTVMNCFILAGLGMAQFVGMDLSAALLIGFAVSFSSTVCAIKVLEDKNEMRARHGQVAVGILVIQDIIAVIFLTLTTDKYPSWWALTLLALPFFKPLFGKLLQYSGHGEVLPLVGFFFAICGGQLFEFFGLKSHLGALVMGMILSDRGKAVELAKSLLAFKDLFLIGFFLSIGFTALPTMDMLGVALIMAIALPFKAGIFFLCLTGFKLRSRTAFLSALSLANYSEFGLIVCSISAAQGLLDKEWLVIMALALTFSFILSSIVNAKAHGLYTRWRGLIMRFEQSKRLPEDLFFRPGDDVKVLVVGLGRVGIGAFDVLQSHWGKQQICGIDSDRERVAAQYKSGYNVIAGDAEDSDFWAQVDLSNIQLVMLSMPKYLDILEVAQQLQQAGYSGKVAAVARYEDEKCELLEAGVDIVFNFYQEAGAGFAEQTLQLVDVH